MIEVRFEGRDRFNYGFVGFEFFVIKQREYQFVKISSLGEKFIQQVFGGY